ncbi:sensor histidine kinase [Glaciihabitans sp. dw_435]|uniref:sensor histidine kinase n=1 Tax=Glaciihabitans sp. dw_435 TaxID=2720081 RepID=UPI001BD6D889|nr:histidine kinase [Glaciihabitans sp. dw_435]
MNPSASNPGMLSKVLSLAGALLVGYWLIREFTDEPVWVLVVSLVSLVAWIAFIFVSRERSVVSALLIILSAVTGAFATGPTAGLLIGPVIAAVLTMIGMPHRPTWHGVVLALAAAVVIPIGALSVDIQPLGLVSMEGGLAIAVIAGFSRRQIRVTQVQSLQLLEQRIVVEEEKARGAALAERQTVARDIHDVLAHSLGGLVLQLDAVDALLEAGRVDDAAVRVKNARAMAASGLAEARRAVDALRDDRRGEPVTAPEFRRTIDELLAAHLSLGGSVDFSVTGTDRELDFDVAEALRRTLQESLTNARKHAPGAPVAVRVDWSRRRVELEVSNPVTAAVPLAAPAGHGLVGMKERVAALDGASVDAAFVDGRFVVHTRLVTS